MGSQSFYVELYRHPPVNDSALLLGLRNRADIVLSPAMTCTRKLELGQSHSPLPHLLRRLLTGSRDTLFGVGLSVSQPATPELVNGFVPTGGPNG